MTSNPTVRNVSDPDGNIDGKLQPSITHIEKETGSSSDSSDAPQHTMTKAVWLACIALGFSYTTAVQQMACTSAIVKHIDAELGISNSILVRSPS
jgi:hypothetical protein